MASRFSRLPRLSRRGLIRAAAALGVLGGVSAIVAVVRTRGYELPPRVRLTELEPWEWLVVTHLARRVCAADRDDVASPDDVDVAGFVDAYAAKMPRRMRRDLGRFFGFVEHLAPIGVGSASRFTRLPPAGQDRVLASLEAHSSDLLRGGFEGTKALVFMGYYRDPRTWSVSGYDGPLVGRPEGGWVGAIGKKPSESRSRP